MAYNERLAERARAMLKGTRGLEEKRMFGGVGFLVNGNLACGVQKDDLILRLGETEFSAAMREPHARIFDMTGRPMKGWLLMGNQGLRAETVLRGWIRKSVSFAKSLPKK
jgi:TfoX/Sxy family transcriptional regulator of competence genes